jgi:hypothetical protein
MRSGDKLIHIKTPCFRAAHTNTVAPAPLPFVLFSSLAAFITVYPKSLKKSKVIFRLENNFGFSYFIFHLEKNFLIYDFIFQKENPSLLQQN